MNGRVEGSESGEEMSREEELIRERYVRSHGVDLHRIISNYDRGRLSAAPRGSTTVFQSRWDHRGRIRRPFAKGLASSKETAAGRRGWRSMRVATVIFTTKREVAA